jgi:hypothetical protein
MRGVWRQFHHHGSIDEPALLADYQRAILGTPLGTTSWLCVANSKAKS